MPKCTLPSYAVLSDDVIQVPIIAAVEFPLFLSPDMRTFAMLLLLGIPLCSAMHGMLAVQKQSFIHTTSRADDAAASGSGSGVSPSSTTSPTLAPQYGCSGRPCAPCGSRCYDCSGLGLTGINCSLPTDLHILCVVVVVIFYLRRHHRCHGRT